MTIRKHIPNLFTLGNLTCGLFALLYAMGGHLNIASGFILLGAFLDFFDGMVARLLAVSGELGKQLDSLADMVTFGVGPSIIAFQFLQLTTTGEFFNPFMEWESRSAYQHYWPYIAFIIPLFSALRLAKFNIDSRQSDGFIGLPTPANALFYLSIPLMYRYQADSVVTTFLTQPLVLSICILLLSFFMVAEIPLFSLKFKNLQWKANKRRFIFLGSSLLLLLIFHFVAVPIIILLYSILSIINKQTQ